ncbi:MAG: pyridoxamine 5'-phosphate oxidase family protein [Ilumatobacteraceae bacterium]|jgi:hypothetical protein|nr:pyridoxamine 5'-phosphate oxidase family protein [Ilumatobacteraceae bacterium]
MLDPATIEFLHGGCALLVGTVDASGRPHAGRGHGLTVLADEPVRVRLLVDAEDTRTVENLDRGALVAVCTADVPTLRSLQLKGRVMSVEPPTPADLAKHRQYADDFTRDIHETDGEPIEILERWADRPVVACVIEIDDTFDQTPGPAAGRRLEDRA